MDCGGKFAGDDDAGWHCAAPASLPTVSCSESTIRPVWLFSPPRATLSALGAVARLFWNPAKALNIPPLHERDAEQLFEAAADHFKLRNLDLHEFREKVLESACGNPGQIIEMCRLATQPQYLAGRYIKFAPLRIDTVMKFVR